MSEKANLLIAERIINALNAHDLTPHGFQSEDYLFEAPGAGQVMGRDQARAYTQGFFDAFPDLHFTPRQKIAQGDYVVINWVATGTHTGMLRTPTGEIIPPTGKKFKVPGSTTYQFKAGMVYRSWTYWDMVTLLAQLGLKPGMYMKRASMKVAPMHFGW